VSGNGADVGKEKKPGRRQGRGTSQGRSRIPNRQITSGFGAETIGAMHSKQNRASGPRGILKREWGQSAAADWGEWARP